MSAVCADADYRGGGPGTTALHPGPVFRAGMGDCHRTRADFDLVDNGSGV